jgi:hypothetical protein
MPAVMKAIKVFEQLGYGPKRVDEKATMLCCLTDAGLKLSMILG